MNTLILDTDNQDKLAQWLAGDSYVVACLCAAWCDTCTAYKSKFDELAALHPNQRFVWIDIEDQAAVVGELDISNFPTLLIQQRDIVCFFGTVQPDLRQADRLLRAQMEKSRAELETEAFSNAERKNWQQDCNLRVRLESA
jgi:thioredoxin 1